MGERGGRGYAYERTDGAGLLALGELCRDAPHEGNAGPICAGHLVARGGSTWAESGVSNGASSRALPSAGSEKAVQASCRVDNELPMSGKPRTTKPDPN